MKNLPDKIYIHGDNDVMGEVLSQRIDGDIEYIRKDAFIEKLETWLNKRHKRDRYTLIYFRKHFKDIINEIMDD